MATRVGSSLRESTASTLRSGLDQTAAQWAWTTLDAGAFGFATATIGTTLPVFFKHISMDALTPHQRTAVWGYSISTVAFSSCILTPLVGAYADQHSRRKLAVISFGGVAMCGVSLASLFGGTGWFLPLVLVILAMIGFSISSTSYAATMQFMFPPERITAASCISCSFSNLGAAIMCIAILVIVHQDGAQTEASLPNATVKLIMLTASAWYAFFLGLFMAFVPEPEAEASQAEAPAVGVWEMLARIRQTLELESMSEVRRYMLALLLISEGSGTVYHMSVIYAISVCGVSHMTVFFATLLNRSLAVFVSVGWAVAAEYYGPHACYLAICTIMLGCVVLCAFLYEEWQYWVLTVLLCVTGSGAFSLGRALLASLVPKEKSSELFGFAAFAGQISGGLGPLLFSIIAQVTGMARFGFVVCFIALLAGIVVFRGIDFSGPGEAGQKEDSRVTPEPSETKKKQGYGAIAGEEETTHCLPHEGKPDPF